VKIQDLPEGVSKLKLRADAPKWAHDPFFKKEMLVSKITGFAGVIGLAPFALGAAVPAKNKHAIAGENYRQWLDMMEAA
jgi:hypothetical protein